ncbi:hypothetical protein BVX98_01375 [bacterium F11]|nr:hypothetical protein BVX98_01375 [bacterium F11]
MLWSKPDTTCPMLWDDVFISEDGNVYACCHSQPAILGNIYENHLRDIVNGESAQRMRRFSLEGKLLCYPSCSLLDKKKIVKNPNRDITTDYDTLKSLKILFGEKCNISCIMCPQDHKRELSIDHERMAQNLDLTPFESIEIQGGEPMFIRSANRFYDYAASHKKKVSFLTNGLLMNTNWAEKIAKHSGWIYVSLNAATKKTHEIVNRGSEWEKVMKNIQMLRTARNEHNTNLKIKGHMTIVKENIDEIPEFIQQHKAFGFDEIDFGFNFDIPLYLKTHPNTKRTLKKQVQEAIQSFDGNNTVIQDLRLKMLGLR